MTTKYMKMAACGAGMLCLSVAGYAHEADEHEHAVEKADCSAMKNMDHAKMDMKDPVMQAMMQKCMKDMPKDEAHAADAQPAQQPH